MKYKFWKENKIDQEYELSPDAFCKLFIEWMKTKDKEWLEHYCFQLPTIFIGEPDGLNSVGDIKTYSDINNLNQISDTKWGYLNKLGIK